MLNIHHCTFYHDKRCIYAYLYNLFVCLHNRKHRLNKIREYRWAVGQLNSEDIVSLMSKGEIRFYQDYDQLLGTYMQNSGFDLTAVCVILVWDVEYVSSSFLVCGGSCFTGLRRDCNNFGDSEYILGSRLESFINLTWKRIASTIYGYLMLSIWFDREF